MRAYCIGTEIASNKLGFRGDVPIALLTAKYSSPIVGIFGPDELLNVIANASYANKPGMAKLHNNTCDGLSRNGKSSRCTAVYFAKKHISKDGIIADRKRRDRYKHLTIWDINW